MGSMRDSQIVAKRLGVLRRDACASPDYLKEHGTPRNIDDMRQHGLIDSLKTDGRRPSGQFTRNGVSVDHKQAPRVSVNDALHHP